MRKVDDEFYEDSSSSLGLSHAAGEASSSTRPRFVTEANPLLSDPDWNDRENERERRRLEEAGEALPPRVVEGVVTRYGQLEDRDVEEQYRAELERIERERHDLTFPEQQALAHDVVAKRQAATGKNAGAYDDVEREIKAVQDEFPELPLIDQVRLARERVDERLSRGEDAVPKTEAERSRAYLDSSVEGLMEQSVPRLPGGGGNKSEIVTFRFCATCDARYDRRTDRSGLRAVATHRKVCLCATTEYISRQESQQLMGAKSSGGGGSKGGKAKEKPKPGAEAFDRRLQTIEAEPRSEMLTSRATPSTVAALEAIEAETGVNLPALIAGIAALKERPDANAQFALRTILKAAPEDRKGNAA